MHDKPGDLNIIKRPVFPRIVPSAAERAKVIFISAIVRAGTEPCRELHIGSIYPLPRAFGDFIGSTEPHARRRGRYAGAAGAAFPPERIARNAGATVGVLVKRLTGCHLSYTIHGPDEFDDVYGQHLPLRTYAVYGGVSINPQMMALRKGVDVLVATPGRLLDHIEAKNCVLNQVEYVVLDEADRMLDIGFLPDLQRILSFLPKQRTTPLFSATFSPEIKKLANSYLQDPVLVEVARANATATTVYTDSWLRILRTV